MSRYIEANCIPDQYVNSADATPTRIREARHLAAFSEDLAALNGHTPDINAAHAMQAEIGAGRIQEHLRDTLPNNWQLRRVNDILNGSGDIFTHKGHRLPQNSQR